MLRSHNARLGSSSISKPRTRVTFDFESYLQQPVPVAVSDDPFAAAYAMFGATNSQNNHFYRPCLRNLVHRFHEYIFLLRDLLAEKGIAVVIKSHSQDMYSMPIHTGDRDELLRSHWSIDSFHKFFFGSAPMVGYLERRKDFLDDLVACTDALGADSPAGVVYSEKVITSMLKSMAYVQSGAIPGIGHLVAVVSDEMFNFAQWIKGLFHKLGYGKPGALKITRLEMEVRAMRAAIEKMGGKIVVPTPPIDLGPLGPHNADTHEDWEDYRVGQNTEFESLQDLLAAFQTFKKRFPVAATYERRAKHCYSAQFSKAGAASLFQHFLDAVGVIPTKEEESAADVSVAQNQVPVTDPVVEDKGDVKLVFDDEEVVVQEVVDVPRPALHPNMAVLHTGGFDVPIQAVRGSHLASFDLSLLKQGNGPIVEELKRCNQVQGHLYVTMKCNMTLAAGCCLAVVYCEGGHSIDDVSEMRRLLLRPHRLWNPACETAIKFRFQPWSCANFFHVDFLDNGTLYFVMISGWNPAPHNPPSVTWSLSFSPDVYVHQEPINVLSLPSEMMYKSYLGTMSFSPLDGKVRVVEANLGKPCVSGTGFGYGLWQSVLGAYSYWLADVILDLARGSSPMVGALVGVAVVPGDQVYDPVSLLTYPHIEVEFGPGRTVKRVLLPKHLFRHNVSSERHDLFGPKQESHVLAIWPIHYTSSSTGDPFVLSAVVAGVRGLQVEGFSPGYVMSSERLLKVGAEVPTKDDMDYYEATEGQNDDWHVFATGVAKEYMSVSFFPPTSTGFLVRSATLCKLFYTACWAKGDFVGKLIWASAGTVTRSAWRSVLTARVILGKKGHVSNSLATSEPSGEWLFSFSILGPVNGFASHWACHGQKNTPRLSVSIVGPEAYSQVMVFVKPVRLWVSGVGKPLWLPAK